MLASVSSVRLLCESGFASPTATLETLRRWVSPITPELAVISPEQQQGCSARTWSARLSGNPASARLWLQAGHGFFSEAQIERARYCILRSVALAPESPPVLVEAAAFLHATGSVDKGLELQSHALGLTRDYDDVIFPLYGRLEDTPAILQRGLPRDREAAQAYFLHLLDRDEPRAQDLAWDWITRHELAGPSLLRRYLRRLIELDRFEQAAGAAKSFLPAEEQSADSNRLHHGGFEAEPSVAPLDWVVTPTADAQVRRDRSTAWEGAWSLRIEFNGAENLEYRHVAQQVVLAPGLWKLSARIRTEGVTTDRGIGLRLFDARSASRWQVWTETVRGDSGWTLIEETFELPAPTRLTQLEIVRRPSAKFDNKLAGVVWVDAVSLKPL